MELEKKKKYFAIYENKIIEITIIKKNKTSYSVLIDNDKKDTLYFNDKEFFIKKTKYFELSHRAYLSNENVKIVNEKEAKIFILNKNIEFYDNKLNIVQKRIEELKSEIEKKEKLKNGCLERKKEYEEQLKKIEKGCD